MRWYCLLIGAFMISVLSLSAQDSDEAWVRAHHFEPDPDAIKAYVRDSLQHWYSQGELETEQAYKQRVTAENRQDLIPKLVHTYLDQAISDFFELEVKKAQYDAENQVFKLKFYGVRPVYFKVPKGSQSRKLLNNQDNLIYKDPEFTYTEKGQIALTHLRIQDPFTRREHTFSTGHTYTFQGATVNQAPDELSIDIKTIPISKVWEAHIEEKDWQTPMDQDIPVTSDTMQNTFAVVIGNDAYSSNHKAFKADQDIPFATNDAHTFAMYCHHTLGVPKSQIKLRYDANSQELNAFLKAVEQFNQEQDSSRVIFYYAGHALTDPEDSNAYLLPVGAKPGEVEKAFSLNTLLERLSGERVQRTTILLDAALSGAGRKAPLTSGSGDQGVSKPYELSKANHNQVIFTASSGKQQAYAYPEKEHGLFTYYLLKKLKASGGKADYGAIADYLQKQVPEKSRELHQENQTPTITISEDSQDQWKSWRFTDKSEKPK